MNIWKAYLRWRHSKGYGVHSPYAYRFVTDVLKPGDYGYYAYHQLESLNRNSKSSRESFFREARFLIRLAVFLHTKRIITFKIKYPEAQILAKALKKVYYCCETPANIGYKAGDLLIIPPGAPKGEEFEASVIERAVENKVPVFAIDPSRELRMLMETPIKNGVLFSGTSRMLIIPRPEMEYVSYSISF